MAHLLAAFDKFRETASAAALAAAAADAARRCGWSADEVPLADGGEGTLTALEAAIGGERHRARVTGPLGTPTEASWLVLPRTAGLPLPPPLVPGDDPVAVVEAARAAGRALLPSPRGDDPLRASTAGVGELVAAALRAGARQVVVAVGGTATTDGGEGARRAIDEAGGVGDTRLAVACDVATGYLDAARTFGPQKGATPAQVLQLGERLAELARRARGRDGVDVAALPGSGAGGGLAGGLAAIGAALVPGFDLVAALVGLERRAARADLVVTGEGHLDATSFEGKVVGGVLAAGGGRLPALCVVGDADPGTEDGWSSRPGAVTLVRLADAVGPQRSRSDTCAAVAEVVMAHLAERRTQHRAGAPAGGSPGPGPAAPTR